ncbi:MAG: HAD family hydrolase [Acidobacteriota bacterium]|nr:HAD family hydrolase [Acidobacteriota bacterium]
MTIAQFESVFLDRDGVLNRKLPEGHYVRSREEFEVLPGVARAIARLNRARKLVVVVSNQRGISQGLFTGSDVEAIHAAFQEVLARSDAHVDGFFYCPHERNRCNCRKPLPGMFEAAVKKFPQIVPESSVMIGDSLSDIEFGRLIGMHTILIDSEWAEESPGMKGARMLADSVYTSLIEAVNSLLGSLRPS